MILLLPEKVKKLFLNLLKVRAVQFLKYRELCIATLEVKLFLQAIGKRKLTLIVFLSPPMKSLRGILMHISFLYLIILRLQTQAAYRAADVHMPAAIVTGLFLGGVFRCNSAEYLYDHLSYLKNKFNIRHINFYDDQFTFNRKRVEAFTEMMISRPMGMTFNCAVRAEHIDYDLLKQMKTAGCWMMSLGIETGDEDLLSQHRQNSNLDMLAGKIRLIKKSGIRTKGLLMMGLPGETEKSIKKSMDYVFSLPIDDFNLSKFTPFPGSPVYEKIHEQGEFNEDWEKMDCMNFLFIPQGLDKARMEELFIAFLQGLIS